MVRTWLSVVTLLICSECLSAQGMGSSTNVVARRCGTVQNVDYIDVLARRQRNSGELARKYAKLANGDSRYVHHAISANGLSSSIDNLGFLYAFTNSPKYAAHATVSIVRILGVNADSIQVAEHVFSMEAVPKEDKVAVCNAIAEMASKSNVQLDDRLFAKNLLRSYEAKVAGAARFADEIPLVVSNIVHNGKHERRTDGSDSDEKIKGAFLLSSDSTSCGNIPSLAYEHAFKLCGADNRRRSRIVVEIAREHPDRVPWALSELSVCGSREDIPFICEWTNDVRCVANAAHALLCIEGVTSNTIACVNAAISREGIDPVKRYAICSAIARMAKAEKDDPSCKALAISSLKRYSRTIPVTALWADGFLLSLDPDYETSDDRKALLREVAERRVNDYQIDYATNALKRIDAKIQAERKGD